MVVMKRLKNLSNSLGFLQNGFKVNAISNSKQNNCVFIKTRRFEDKDICKFTEVVIKDGITFIIK